MKTNRRRFLSSASALILSGLASKALAWRSGSAAVSASAFNGGKSQIQNWDLGFGDTSYPFLNLMKTGSRWRWVGASGALPPNLADSDGYPTGFAAGATSVVSNILIPTNAQRSGNYVVTWTGASTIGFNGQTMSTVSGSVTASGGVGRYVFTPDPSYSQINLAVLASGFTSISNIKVFHADDENALNGGEIFGTQFLSVMRAMNCGVIRFGDWAQMNNTNVTTWATRRSASYCSYAAEDLRAAGSNALWCGTTTSSSDNYAITGNGTGVPATGAPTDRMTIVLIFDHTGGSSSTLNLNGTGAVSITNPYGDTLSSGFFPTVNNNACVVYDAALNTWLLTTNNGALANGVPPEVCLSLAIKLGSHPHFVTPYLSCDPITDYISSLASYVHANRPSWLNMRLEGPNETWNFGSGFYATRYSWNKATLYWGFPVQADQNNWYGLVIRNIGSALSSEFGGDTTKYSILCGVKLVNGTAASQDDPRLNSQKRTSNIACTVNSGNGNTAQITAVGNGLAANTPINIVSTSSTATVPSPLVKNNTLYYVKTPGDTFTISATPGGAAIVYNGAQVWNGNQFIVIADQTLPATYVTHVCPSDYITPSEYQSNQELVRAYNWSQGDNTQLNLYVDSLATTASGGNANENLSNCLLYYQGWKAWAAGFSVNKMCAYEGGYSFNTITTNSSSTITGATQANPCVLTLATSSSQGQVSRSGNPAVVGMTLSLASVGGMTQLNGNTYTITAVSGNSVTINVDATGFGAYTSGGTATYVGSGVLLNNFRLASKAATNLQGYTYGTPNVGSATNYGNFVTVAGGEFPSQYMLAGTSSPWGMYDPGVYSTPSPAQAGIVAFNH